MMSRVEQPRYGLSDKFSCMTECRRLSLVFADRRKSYHVHYCVVAAPNDTPKCGVVYDFVFC